MIKIDKAEDHQGSGEQHELNGLQLETESDKKRQG